VGLFVNIKKKKMMVPSTARLFPVQDYIFVISVFFLVFYDLFVGLFVKIKKKRWWCHQLQDYFRCKIIFVLFQFFNDIKPNRIKPKLIGLNRFWFELTKN
jgi:preprotein translocase subunit Sec63